MKNFLKTEMFNMEEIERTAKRIAELIVHRKLIENEKNQAVEKIKVLKEQIAELENTVRHHNLRISMDKQEIISLLDDEAQNISLINGD